MKKAILSIVLLVCSTQAVAQAHPPKILLLPFTIINGSGLEWIGDSIEQSLHADLPNASIAHNPLISSDDSAAIARIGHNASADYIVQGQVQIVGDQVRLTGAVFNSTGAPVGSAKATGELRHLFDLEDALADKIRQSLAKSSPTKRIATTPIPVIEGSSPIRVAAQTPLPMGTVPECFSSAALRDGRDRYLYQIPYYGCASGWGYGGYGYCGFGGYGSCFGGGLNGGYSTGGTHSLPW